jgi:predicted NBD/HSP70 family sugar kinase
MRRIDLKNFKVASSDVVRDINRVILLSLIRSCQPVSRADLARLSGLQRSTVSLIMEQLIDEKWVVEGPTGRLPRGRRPTFLRLNDQRVIIGVDIRPVQTTIALADVNGRFLSQEAFATPSNPAKAVDRLNAVFRHLIQTHSDKVFDGIGISLPGRFDVESQRLVFAPNLKWPSFDLKTPLERATRLHVELENAANACVLAEVWFGQTEGIRDLVVVTVSEGIGTGILSNGHLVRGMNGMAGEFGHVQIDAAGPRCACGGRGCWEVFASNRAAVRYYHESQSSTGGPQFPDLLQLAEKGDGLAVKAFDKMAHYFGRGLRMIAAGLAPEVIVVVGEFTRLWHRFGPVIEAEVAAQTLAGRTPKVVPAQEGQTARLRGTIALILQKHFGDGRVAAPLHAARSERGEPFSFSDCVKTAALRNPGCWPPTEIWKSPGSMTRRPSRCTRESWRAASVNSTVLRSPGFRWTR